MQPLDPELQRLIRDGLPQALPTPEVEARVLQCLLRRIEGGDGGDGGGPEPGGETVTVTSARFGGGLKVALAVGSIAAAIVVAVSIGRAEPAPASSSQPVSAARPVPAVGPPVRALEVPADEPPASAASASLAPGERDEAPAARARTSRRAGQRAAAPPSPPPSPSLPPSSPSPTVDPLLDETRRVGLADAALTRGDYRHARELVEELARVHPRGQLVLEREAIDICSRCGLADPGAAAAAAAFLGAHAGTPVAARVHARCDAAIRASAE